MSDGVPEVRQICVLETIKTINLWLFFEFARMAKHLTDKKKHNLRK